MRRLADAPKLLRSVSLANSRFVHRLVPRLAVPFPPEIRRMSTHAMLRLSRPAEHEVVEDSEPEREEQRLQRKARKKRYSPEKDRGHTDAAISGTSTLLAANKVREGDVIVISDDSDIPASKQSALKAPSRIVPDTALEVEDNLSPDDYDWGQLTDDELLALSDDYGSLPATQSLPSQGAQRALSREPQSPVTVHSESDLSEGENAGSKKLVDFARYAYTGSRASSASFKSRPSLSRAPSIVARAASTMALPSPRPPAKRSVATAAFVTTFSENELKRLLKCVSCDLSWTTRKTVAQKTKHIRSCAKKKKFDDDTIAFLIREELARYRKKEAEAASAAIAEAAPQTLLENTVQEEIPKKKGRRPHVVETVKELTDTRQTILERARLLLQSEPSRAISTEASAIASTSKIPSPARSPPLTQPFGESALALKFRSKARPEPTQPPIYVPSPSEIQPDRRVAPSSPPRTQAFGESSLAKQFHVKSSYVDLDSSPIYAPSPLAERNHVRDTLELSPTPRRLELEDADLLTERTSSRGNNPMFVRSSSRRGSESEAARRRRSVATVLPEDDYQSFPPRQEWQSPDSPTMRAQHARNGETDGMLHFEPDEDWRSQEVFEWEQDDAMLHYEPNDFSTAISLGHQSSSSSSFSSSKRSSICSKLPTNSIAKAAKSKSKEVVRCKPKPARKTRASRSPSLASDTEPPLASQLKKGRKPRAQAIAMTDKELFIRMRRCILDDTQLYLRILRYEPIHFDVFHRLAMDLGVSSRGLKLRVRAFLDQQAIHFYGLEISKSRTKRRRR